MSDSLTHLFATNDPLTPSESTLVQNALDIQDTAIHTLEKELRALQLQRARYASLLAPLRSKPLPIELWGDIFAIVIARLHAQLDDECPTSATGARRASSLGTTSGSIRENVSRARTKLIQLCLVCRAWRDAVYATPYLWSRLDIYWPSLDFDKIVRWFGLARAHPRKRLCISPTHLYGFKEWQFDVLERLMEEGPLIEYLELDMMNETSHLGEGGRLYRSMVGRLRYPKAKAKGGKGPGKGKRPWDLVKSFSVHLDEANANLDQVVIPFQHLTTLHLALPGFYDFVSWNDNEDDTAVPFKIPKTTLENLTTLSITQCDWKRSVLVAVLRWCTNLTHLTLSYATATSLDASASDDNDLSTTSSSSSSTTSGVHLPVLRTLVLRNLDPRVGRVYPSDYQSVLGVLTMPNLVELDMGFAKVLEWHPEDGGDDPEDPEYRWQDCELLERGMRAFGERVVKDASAKLGGEPRLSKLRLHNLYISSTSLTSILQALPPSISHLTLDSVYSDSTLFKRLEQASSSSTSSTSSTSNSTSTSTSPHKPFLPKLQTLQLWNLKKEFGTHVPDVYAFVASRRLFGEFNVPGMEETVALKELRMSIIEREKGEKSGKSEGEKGEKGEGRGGRGVDILRAVYGVDVDVRVVSEGDD
ncbi:hypothetical protein MD484_g513, partial [Candolleomyces efflorescens]